MLINSNNNNGILWDDRAEARLNGGNIHSGPFSEKGLMRYQDDVLAKTDYRVWAYEIELDANNNVLSSTITYRPFSIATINTFSLFVQGVLNRYNPLSAVTDRRIEITLKQGSSLQRIGTSIDVDSFIETVNITVNNNGNNVYETLQGITLTPSAYLQVIIKGINILLIEDETAMAAVNNTPNQIVIGVLLQ